VRGSRNVNVRSNLPILSLSNFNELQDSGLVYSVSIVKMHRFTLRVVRGNLLDSACRASRSDISFGASPLETD